MLFLAACCLGHLVPLEERFLLTISGVPMAVLRIEVREGVYRYEATHFLDEGEARFARSWLLDERGEIDGVSPEVLALLQPPPAGCRRVLEERRAARETLCVDVSTPTRASGRLDGAPFVARYEGGRLVAVTLPGVEWTHLEGSPAGGKPSKVFSQGFEVRSRPGPWRLEPAVGDARLVTAPVRGTGLEEEVGRGQGQGQGQGLGRKRCLVLARRALEGDAALALVLGLVVEGGRAYPHAWVRRGAIDEDPSLLPSDEEVIKGRAYLELPREIAGRVYLELLDGRRRVVGAGSRSRRWER